MTLRTPSRVLAKQNVTVRAPRFHVSLPWGYFGPTVAAGGTNEVPDGHVAEAKHLRVEITDDLREPVNKRFDFLGKKRMRDAFFDRGPDFEPTGVAVPASPVVATGQRPRGNAAHQTRIRVYQRIQTETTTTVGKAAFGVVSDDPAADW